MMKADGLFLNNLTSLETLCVARLELISVVNEPVNVHMYQIQVNLFPFRPILTKILEFIPNWGSHLGLVLLHDQLHCRTSSRCNGIELQCMRTWSL